MGFATTKPVTHFMLGLRQALVYEILKFNAVEGLIDEAFMRLPFRSTLFRCQRFESHNAACTDRQLVGAAQDS
jgi:hypothetical protein